tara:strand:- start:81 stop:395 length:315 start_codon:yes stop_codon:yes gene_type:complete
MNDKENKIIALFMGLKPHHQDAGYLIDESKDEGYEAIHESCFLYNTSWDWLMPVVCKIEDGGLDPHEMIDNALGSRKIEDVHDTCVTLIKAYNNEEKENTKRVR